MLAPIALFVYRRPQQTLRLLRSLASNLEAASSDLWVFCEGPKNEIERDAIDQVRMIVRSQPWAKTITIVEHVQNLGCANSIIAGIATILEKHDRVIVLEDDLILSSHFLSFMNEALQRYQDVDRLMQVCGYMYPLDLQDDQDVVFLPHVSSWGWATWRRAWDKFDPQMASLPWLDRWPLRRYRFDLHGAYPYRKMIDLQQTGEIDAWDIRWYLSFFRNNGLAAYPRKSLVVNDGFFDGTHATPARYGTSLNNEFKVLRWPQDVRPDPLTFRRLGDFMHGTARPARVRWRQLMWGYCFPRLRNRLAFLRDQVRAWRHYS